MSKERAGTRTYGAFQAGDVFVHSGAGDVFDTFMLLQGGPGSWDIVKLTSTSPDFPVGVRREAWLGKGLLVPDEYEVWRDGKIVSPRLI